MSASHLRGDDAQGRDEIPDALISEIDARLPGLGERLRSTNRKKAARRKRKNSFSPPPYTVQVQVSRRNPLRVQAQNELYIQAYTMAAQAGQQFPLKLLFELLTVDGKDRIMPILEQVDQQTQMLEALQQENAALKESNANLQGTLDDYNSKIMGAQPNMSAQALGVARNRDALAGVNNG